MQQDLYTWPRDKYFAVQPSHLVNKCIVCNMYLPHGKRMHNTLRECSRHTNQVRYQPGPVTTTGEKLSQSDNKINGNRMKRTWRSARQLHQVIMLHCMMLAKTIWGRVHKQTQPVWRTNYSTDLIILWWLILINYLSIWYLVTRLQWLPPLLCC